MFIIYYHGLWTCSMASFLLSPCLNHQLCVCKQTSEQAWQTERERECARERGWKREKRERYLNHWKKEQTKHILSLLPLCALLNNVMLRCCSLIMLLLFFDSAVGLLVLFFSLLFFLSFFHFFLLTFLTFAAAAVAHIVIAVVVRLDILVMLLQRCNAQWYVNYSMRILNKLQFCAVVYSVVLLLLLLLFLFR